MSPAAPPAEGAVLGMADNGASYIDDLENFIKAPGFKHKDFWDRELGG